VPRELIEIEQNSLCGAVLRVWLQCIQLIGCSESALLCHVHVDLLYNVMELLTLEIISYFARIHSLALPVAASVYVTISFTVAALKAAVHGHCITPIEGKEEVYHFDTVMIFKTFRDGPRCV
jgi:hypothetical protein